MLSIKIVRFGSGISKMYSRSQAFGIYGSSDDDEGPYMPANYEAWCDMYGDELPEFCRQFEQEQECLRNVFDLEEELPPSSPLFERQQQDK